MGLKKFGEFEGAHNEALEQQKQSAWKVIDSDRTILDVAWRSAGKWGTVGIVAVHNTKMDYWTAYMGIAGEGHDEKNDARAIADYGSKLMENEAKAYFPNIKDIKYKMAD